MPPRLHAGASSLRPALLLVAEGDPVLIHLTTTALERRGHKTYQAADGEQAMKLAMQHLRSLDLVLVDEWLPLMNGSELSRFLLALRPDLKVIVMSGGNSSGPLPPGTSILSKPFTLEELFDLVSRQLRGDESPESVGDG